METEVLAKAINTDVCPRNTFLVEKTMASNLEDRYKFDGKKRGRAVIISNAKFWLNSGYKYRLGARADLNRMKKLFTRLGFSVKAYSNLTAGEMEDYLTHIAQLEEKKPNPDCFVCVISSHGEQLSESVSGGDTKYHKHVIAGIDGKSVETGDLISLFDDKNCRSLKGKPKFFFIQACRGDIYPDNTDAGYDKGVLVSNGSQNTTQGKDTVDRKTSSDSQITLNEDDYDSSDAELDSDYSDEDYMFPQQCKTISEEQKEEKNLKFDGETPGQILSSHKETVVNANQVENLPTDGAENPDVPKSPESESLPDGAEKGGFGDTLDARDPNAKNKESDIKQIFDDKVPSEKTDDSNAKSLLGTKEAGKGDVADGRGIPAKNVHVVKEVIHVVSVPCFTDMMIMFASPPGKYAIRSQDKGSWMLTALYGYMKDRNYRLEDKDFLSSLVEISGEIARNMEFSPEVNNSKEYKFKGSKSVPCITHMLQGDVYFDDDKLKPKTGLLSCFKGSQ